MRIKTLFLASAGAAGADATRENPFNRILGLLKAMNTQLIEDGKKDAALYEKMKCWCEESLPALEKSIKENSDALKAHTAAQRAAEGAAAKLNGELVKLREKINEKTKEMEAQRKQRAEETASFTDELGTTTESLNATIDALGALSSVFKGGLGGRDADENAQGAFLQAHTHSREEMVTQVTSTLREQLKKQLASTHFSLSEDQSAALSSLLQAPSYGQYESQSGTVVGILQSMRDTFAADIKTLQEDEDAAAESYLALKANGEKILADYETSVAFKEQKLADESAKAAKNRRAAGASHADLEGDTAALDGSRETCETNYKNYAKRSADRKIEQASVSKALSVLNSDEVRAHFGRLSNRLMSFMQITTTASKSRRTQDAHTEVMTRRIKAAQLLRKTGEPKLLILAQSLEDHADGVQMIIEAIDQLIAELQKTLASDSEEYESCNDSIAEKEAIIATLEAKRVATETENAAMVEEIERLTGAIADAEDLVATSELALKNAGSQRDDANKQFNKEYQDTETAIEIIDKVMGILQEAYEAPPETSFIQSSTTTTVTQPPQEELATPGQVDLRDGPGGFTDYEAKRGSGVIGSLMDLKSDLREELQRLKSQEHEAARLFAGLTARENALIMRKHTERATALADKATTEMKLENGKDSLGATEESLAEERQGLVVKREEECKFILANFEARSEHLNAEVEALGGARGLIGEIIGST